MNETPEANEPASTQGPIEPYIPASQTLPEITIKAVVLGVLLSVLLAGANAYLGLKAGMTVSASIPAAVISMAVLRLFRRSNILENNIVQTAASAGESLAAGVIFTLPALVVLKHWTSFNYWQTTVIAALGGMIGVLFTIPLRRALIAQSALKFPEGVATAEVLKVGDKGGAGIQMIFLGAVIGALFKLGDTGLKLWKGVVEGGAQLGGSIGYYGTNVSPALLAVGYIVGINIAVLVFLGGALNWYVAIPIVAASDSWPVYSLKEEAVGEAPARPATEEDVKPRPPWTVFELELAEEKPVTAEMTDAEMAEVTETNEAIRQANSELLAKVGTPVEAADYANKIWSKGTRFLGVGAMVVGGLWALLRLWKSLLASLVSSSRAYRSTLEGGEETIRRTDRDTPMKIVGLLLVVSAIPVFYVFEYVTKSVGIAAVMAIVMLIAGFLFSAVASYMAGLVGSSNNPISGMTIATLLTSALLLLALGMDEATGPAAAILIGAVVCCAAAIGGDNMQDLKAGQLVGATPYKQQIMQAIGVLAAAVVMAPVLNALLKAYGIGPITVEGQEALEAPQASLMKSVAAGVFGDGMPWSLVFTGMGIAAVVIILDVLLEIRGSRFRMPVLAVAVGIYLPLELSVPIFIGGLISWVAHRFHMRRIAGEADGELKSSLQEAKKAAERRGLLMAAGLITGEAMLGILLAIPLAAWEGQNRIAEFFIAMTGVEDLWWPGLVLLVLVMALLGFVAARRTSQ